MKKKPLTFRGHGVFATLGNMYLALAVFGELFVIERFIDFSQGQHVYGYTATMLMVHALIGALAYPTYLFYELKHLIDKNSIVGKRDFVAVVSFGSQSLVGLAIQVAVFIKAFEVFPIAEEWKPLSLFVMSFCAAYGGCLGLTDLAFPWPPFVVEHTKIIMNSPKLRATCLLTMGLLYIITIWFI